MPKESHTSENSRTFLEDRVSSFVALSKKKKRRKALKKQKPRKKFLFRFAFQIMFSFKILLSFRPCWIITERNYVRVHAQTFDGQISCFANFNSAQNCKDGFFYINQNGSFKICKLMTQMNLENAAPLRKIPIRSNVHKIAFSTDPYAYAVAVSNPVPRKFFVNDELVFNASVLPQTIQSHDQKFEGTI